MTLQDPDLPQQHGDAPAPDPQRSSWGDGRSPLARDDSDPARDDSEAELRRVERALKTPLVRLLGPFATVAMTALSGLGSLAPILVVLALLGVSEWATVGRIALVAVTLLVLVLTVAALILIVARRS
jgi:hypothetical protein